MIIATCLLTALPLVAEMSREFHYKTEMTGGGIPGSITSESWIKGDRIRVLTKTPVGVSSMVVKDKTIYMKTGGMAMKMSVDQQKSTQPRPADYGQALEQQLKGATKIGTEMVDGEMCAKWHTVRAEDGTSVDQTMWISPSLQFPRKVVIKTGGEDGEMTIHNTGIEKKVTLSDKDFEPEAGVEYMDMSEMMKRAQGTQPEGAKKHR